MMKQPTPQAERRLHGFITELDLLLAEREFPGIARFFRECQPAPPTFLDLLCRFQASRSAG